jgi:hypothetical protein
MKNHKLIPIIVISIFIAGCTNAGKNQAIKTTKDSKDTSAVSISTGEKNTIFIDVKSVNKTSTFSFGMSKDNVMAKLRELKIEVKDEIEITSRKDDPEFGNKVVLADGISFSFDKNNQLYAISCNEKIPTSLGLKKGDLLKKAEELYGKSYNKYTTENGLVYEYAFNDHYFKVFIEAGKVSEWAVSKYKFFK